VDENSHDTFRHYIDALDRSTEIDTPTINTGTSHGWQVFTYPSATEVDTYTGITSTTPSTSCTFCRHDVSTYDGNGRVTRNTLASDPDGQTFTDTAYDSTSRTSSVSNPYRSTSDPTYGLESFQYDGMNRQTRNTHQDTNYIQMVYGAAVSGSGGAASQLCVSGTYGLGYPVLSIDEAGKKQQSWQDGFGRTIEADEPDSSGALTVGTCYKYDVLNNQTQVAQGSQTRTYGYDGLSRQTSSSEPESGTTTSFYTTSGGALCSGVAANACRISDARSITTTYVYDSRDRLTSKTYSDNTTHSVTYSYGQTPCNGLTITNGLNRRTCMTDAAGTTAWSYDPAGHIITEKRTIGTITKTISNTYNLDGSVAQKTYPSTNVITYTYNNAQRVTAVQNNSIGKNYATGITYAPQGAVSSVLENQGGGFAGITYTRSYNNRLQLTVTRATSSNGTTFDLAYAYDLGGGVNNGNLVNLTNNRDTTRSVSYTYDTLNRVSTAQTSGSTGSFCWGQGFGYDRFANLLNVSVTKCSAPSLSVTVDNGNHVTGSPYNYDAAGNMMHDNNNAYTFDAENRLTTGNGTTFTHDGDDWRVKKSSGELEWHDTSCGGDLVDVFDLSGNLKAEYYYVGHMLFASRSFYYFGDNVDSVRVITDTTGNVQRESDYYAFGGELPVVTTISDVRKFNGKKRDTETSLDYSHFRMSNSTLGRWLSVDPVGADLRQPQTLNRYAYVANNPVNKIDPQGLFSSPGGISSTTVKGPNGSITSVDTVVNVNETVDPVPLDGGEVGGGGGISAARIPYHPFLDTPTFGPRNPGGVQPKPKPKPQPDWQGFEQCCAATRQAYRHNLGGALTVIVPSAVLFSASVGVTIWAPGVKTGEGILEGLEVLHMKSYLAIPGAAAFILYIEGVKMSNRAQMQFLHDEGDCQSKYGISSKGCNVN
jgi:RHS repeat-associated protein